MVNPPLLIYVHGPFFMLCWSYECAVYKKFSSPYDFAVNSNEMEYASNRIWRNLEHTFVYHNSCSWETYRFFQPNVSSKCRTSAELCWRTMTKMPSLYRLRSRFSSVYRSVSLRNPPILRWYGCLAQRATFEDLLAQLVPHSKRNRKS